MKIVTADHCSRCDSSRSKTTTVVNGSFCTRRRLDCSNECCEVNDNGDISYECCKKIHWLVVISGHVAS